MTILKRTLNNESKRYEDKDMCFDLFSLNKLIFIHRAISVKLQMCMIEISFFFDKYTVS